MTKGMCFMPVLPFAVMRQYSSLNIALPMCMVKSSPGRRAASKRTYIIALSRLLAVALMIAIKSSWVSRFSGVTLGFFSFMARLIQFTSIGMGVSFVQLPFLAYWTSFRRVSFLSCLVHSLCGLLFIVATTVSMSCFVMSLRSTVIRRSSAGR